jgi:hypothetical protein
MSKPGSEDHAYEIKVHSRGSIAPSASPLEGKEPTKELGDRKGTEIPDLAEKRHPDRESRYAGELKIAIESLGWRAYSERYSLTVSVSS